MANRRRRDTRGLTVALCVLLTVLLLGLLLIYWMRQRPAVAPTSARTPGSAGSRSPSNRRAPVNVSLLPDARLTPGAVFDVTAAEVCRPGYAKSVRNVPQSLKNKVYRLYGRSREPGVCCEVDHLISLELGGSNDVRNLWPEPYQPRPGAYEKDYVENWLHDEVCDGRMTLADAQREIATDWYATYLRAKARRR